MYYTLRHPLVIEKFTKVINAMCQAVPSSKVVTACKQLNFYCRLHDNRKAIIVFFKVACVADTLNLLYRESAN